MLPGGCYQEGASRRVLPAFPSADVDTVVIPVPDTFPSADVDTGVIPVPDTFPSADVDTCVILVPDTTVGL